MTGWMDAYAMSQRNEIISRIDDALAQYRANGPTGSIAIDLASALREARELIPDPAITTSAVS